jgi:hypothetical protein
VWKAAAVMARLVETALRRNCTAKRASAYAPQCLGDTPTVSPIAYHGIEGSHKVGEDGIGIVEACEHGDDVGAGVGVFLAEGGI